MIRIILPKKEIFKSFVLQNSEMSHASIFTGEEELFAFERTISRLAEMQSEEYWNHRNVITTS